LSARHIVDEFETVEERRTCRAPVTGTLVASAVGVVAVKEVVEAFKLQGVLTLTAGKHVVRFLPPLTISEGDLEEVVDMMSDALDGLFGE
jgi:acetylornithine/succinyldiaminopimelate/putrescine aminotransferase